MTCSIRFPDRLISEPKDTEEGCVLPNGHLGPHEFIATNGKRYEWETDMECDCDDCLSDEPDDWCIVYSEVK